MSRNVDTNKKVNVSLEHFVLRVADLQRSIDWYTNVLDMEVVHRNPMICFMTYDDEHHRLALAQTPVEADIPRGAPGLDHVAYTLGSLDDLVTKYKQLKAKEIMPAWPINHGLTTSLYYADPDGNRVEFQVENFASKEELNAYMRGDKFAENPIGMTFEPEDLLQRYEAGDALEDLVRIGFDR
ncbi:MAG: VOC family protein [Pseudomonadota bacterium]